MNLRRWWSDRLGGNDTPPLFTWDELSVLRWGPADGDPTPGIVIDRPDRGRMPSLQPADDDPDAVAEREAIQSEAEQ